MVVDHGGLVAWTGLFPATFAVGRLAWPLFALVVALRLAERPDRARGYVPRLLGWAIVAWPAYLAIAGQVRANVLVTLAVGAAVTAALLGTRPRRGWLVLGTVGLVLSPWIDFGPPGVLLVPVLTLLARRDARWAAWACGPLAWAGQAVLAPDAGPWLLAALAASPLAALLMDPGWDPPRLPRLAFYAFYPAHLWLLWGWMAWAA